MLSPAPTLSFAEKIGVEIVDNPPALLRESFMRITAAI